MKTVLFSLSLLVASSQAFTSLPTPSFSSSSTAINLIDTSDVEDVGYYVTVKKPIGVVFGENKEPYCGLRVDDVEIGTEGSRVGLRVGDQLLAVNGNPVIGDSFDGAMSVLQSAPARVKLLMYRGNVASLYTILDNRGLSVGYDDGSDEVIMDESYESPVRVEVIEDKGFDFGLAMSRLVGGGKKEEMVEEEEEVYEEPPPPPKKQAGGFFGMFEQSSPEVEAEVEEEVYEEPPPPPKTQGGGFFGMFEQSSPEVEEEVEEEVYEEPTPPPKKKGGGLFGMFGESVQLEGDDASGTGT